MWARLHFINGYSPIRPAGVAKQFYFSIHGEIDPGTARLLFIKEAGPNGLLSQLGVDGITIAQEMEFNPEPAAEWEQIVSNSEGRVFHRRGPPLSRMRSVASLPAQPDQTFAIAAINSVQDLRNRVVAEVEVPAGDRPALISYGRPYFEGYQASLGGTKLTVRSDRGLYPLVEVPAGNRGRLVLTYRPLWLVYGTAIALSCAVVWLAGLIAACRRQRR
jgi:hypothetical protein